MVVFQAPPSLLEMASGVLEARSRMSALLQAALWRVSASRIAATPAPRRATTITQVRQRRGYDSDARNRIQKLRSACSRLDRLVRMPFAVLEIQYAPKTRTGRSGAAGANTIRSDSIRTHSQWRPNIKGLPLFKIERHFSTSAYGSRPTLSASLRSMRMYRPNQHVRKATTSAFNNLAHLEKTANSHPDSASSQTAFYTALLRAGRPDIVVQRYEMNRFATNTACDLLYQRALEKQGQASTGGLNEGELNAPRLSAEQISAVGQAVGAQVKGASIASTKAGGAGKGSPLYVVVEESFGSTFFRWFKLLAWLSFSLWLVFAVTTVVGDSLGNYRRPAQGSTRLEANPQLQKTRFSDVHGCDEAKDELQELVAFLKNPKRFTALGGKLPKGVLLTGPPGTGKTLLARAVAGEAGVPFFYMSGSEFDEVYVGVGAKRVRELFNAARSKGAAIIFIDELDAIGGRRQAKDQAFAKQTLNQLLTELDGFDKRANIIVLAATNFPETLDAALTRPGRFDRNVAVPLPDVRGRVAILKHHTRNMPMASDVDHTLLGRGTPGFSGADLENLANQAAIRASKADQGKVSMSDFEWAKDRIMLGAERRSAVIQAKDKIKTAYHEGGHALVAMYSKDADQLYKVTIMPRGHALGITFQLPEMDRVSMTKKQYLAHIDVCMGGKIAEEMLNGADSATSGASSDLQTATSLAYQLVTAYGMSERLGSVDLHSNYNRLPAQTQQMIWDEIRGILEESKQRTKKLLESRRKELDLLARALIKYETLNKEETEKVVRGEELKGRLTSDESTPMKMPELSAGETLAPGPLPGSDEKPSSGPSSSPPPPPRPEPPRPEPPGPAGSGGFGVPLPPVGDSESSPRPIPAGFPRQS